MLGRSGVVTETLDAVGSYLDTYYVNQAPARTYAKYKIHAKHTTQLNVASLNLRRSREQTSKRKVEQLAKVERCKPANTTNAKQNTDNTARAGARGRSQRPRRTG